MNLYIFGALLCTTIFTQTIRGALAPIPQLILPCDLISLVEWVLISSSLSPKEARAKAAEKISHNEPVPRAYLVGAALDPRYGNPQALLASILSQRALLSQSSSIFTYYYFKAYRGTGIGIAWGFRPKSITGLIESDDLKSVLSLLTKDVIDIEIDLLALKNEDAWVDYSLVTAYALIKKYGSNAHKNVSALLQNRMAFVEAPASKNLTSWTTTTPLFIDSLISPDEYQAVVEQYPVLSLEQHNGLTRKPQSFLWEIYQHTFIDIDTYIAARKQQNLPLPPPTKHALAMLKNGTLAKQCAVIHAKILDMLIAEKLGDSEECAATKNSINATLAGES